MEKEDYKQIIDLLTKYIHHLDGDEERLKNYCQTVITECVFDLQNLLENS